MNRTNVITIEKNIPIPPFSRGGGSFGKYNFVEVMSIGDSFVVNGNTPDITPRAIKCWIYNQRVKGRTSSLRNRRYTMRTLSGGSKNPTSIRIWRVR